MRKQTQNWTGWRSALAVAAGLGLAWGAQAALEGSLVDGLSYYSSFDNPDNGSNTDKPERENGVPRRRERRERNDARKQQPQGNKEE